MVKWMLFISLSIKKQKQTKKNKQTNNRSSGIVPLRDDTGIDCTQTSSMKPNCLINISDIGSNRLPGSPITGLFHSVDGLKYIQQLKASSGGGPDGLPASFFLRQRNDLLLRRCQLVLTNRYKLVLFQTFGSMYLLLLSLRKDHLELHVITDQSSFTRNACKLMKCGVKLHS